MRLSISGEIFGGIYRALSPQGHGCWGVKGREMRILLSCLGFLLPCFYLWLLPEILPPYIPSTVVGDSTDDLLP